MRDERGFGDFMAVVTAWRTGGVPAVSSLLSGLAVEVPEVRRVHWLAERLVAATEVVDFLARAHAEPQGVSVAAVEPTAHSPASLQYRNPSMEAYVHGVSTRKVDDLVAALGAKAGSPSRR